MQIHELNRPRRTDEGVLGAIGTALGHSVAKGAGYDLSKNNPTASAGILDPKQKLAAVMKEPAMVKLATEYANEWLKTQAQGCIWLMMKASRKYYGRSQPICGALMSNHPVSLLF